MKISARLSHRFSWINPVAAAPIALLQRTPAVRFIVAADELVAVSPIGHVLKSALAVVATLCAFVTLASADGPIMSQTAPLSATVGVPLSPVAVTATNAMASGSWVVTGSLPPGLLLFAAEDGTTLRGPGLLDATKPGTTDMFGNVIGGDTTTTPFLSGTPTASGSYSFALTGYTSGNATGSVSYALSYTVVVAAADAVTVPDVPTPPPVQPTDQSTPLSATVGVPITPVAITAAKAVGIGSWLVDGSLPPGLALSAIEGGDTLTGPGLLDATTPDMTDMDGNVIMGGITTTTPLLSGTPTASGSYTFTLTAYEFGDAGGMVSNTFSYTVVVADAAVVAAPVFATQPIAVAVVSGSTVALTAAASGSPSYQWAQDGNAIPGATSATLLINGATSANAGNYTCTATNSSGSTASDTAALSITDTTDVGRLTSLSTRAVVGTGADVLVVGFVVGGGGTTGTKPMLIRGTGPTLANFGVSGVLADPMLTLFQGSTVVAANDNWGGDSQIAAQDAASGAFTQSNPSSLDSALYLNSVAPGTYSAMVAGNNNGTGVALAEVYDLTGSASYTATTPRLTSISSRVKVGTGDSILIVGFVIGGSSAKTVLIRASGPALDQFGVPGTLPDPVLTLYRSDSTAIAANNGWAGDPQIVSTAASVQAFTWTSASSNDSALLVTLPPGLYTAGVAGASGDTGVALVEVYEVP